MATNILNSARKEANYILKQTEKAVQKKLKGDKKSAARLKWELANKLFDSAARFRYNVVKNRIERASFKKDDWQQANANRLWHWINDRGGNFHFGTDFIENMLLAKAQEHVYNPLEQVIKDCSKTSYNMPFFQKQDCFKNLAAFIFLSRQGDEDEEDRLYRSLKRFFLSATKMVYKPFYAQKQCLVFNGVQSIGKTPFTQSLMPTNLRGYIKKNPSLSFEAKDAKVAMASNLFILIDEVDLFLKNRDNRNNYKSFFSLESIQERLPYGRTPETFYRKASLIATCNTSQFLNDPTGSHRWVVFDVQGFFNDKYAKKNGWPFSCQTPEFRQVVDACWGAAYKMMIDGVDLDMTDEELIENERNNEKYKFNSMEYELLIRYFKPGQKCEEGVKFMTATELCQDLNKKQVDVRFTSVGLGKELIRAGFARVSYKVSSISKYGYFVKEIDAFTPI